MSKDRFTLPAAVFLFLIQGDKILLMRRSGTGWHDGDYDLAAGHIDGNESLTTTVCREAHEEMGITIDPVNVKFVNLMHAYFAEDGKEYFDIYFEVEKWQGEPKIMEPGKCDDMQWFSLDRLPENLTPSTQMGLAAYQARSSYTEFGFE
ncbi:MAG TPA: NUDIX domain-containing protein [Candidatus Acidoferrum sp.]|nr:NUDIX domain-containing protein [Candidatus Acidoferrum sp.]